MRSEIESTPYEVAIIGGGPAGSVAATWLARQGHRVALLEKERFPRFHIGESLLPNGNKILKEIGVWEKIQNAGFVEKRGAEFTLPDRSQSIVNVFARGIVKDLGQTYQVERSRFDQILFDHATESGAISRQETTVSQAEQVEGLWQLSLKCDNPDTPDTLSAKWLIDASGRNSFMGRKLGFRKEELPYPGRVAIFNHFTGIDRAAGDRSGDIIVMRLEDAWFWLIPISPTVTSVGVVAHKGAGQQTGESRETFFNRKVSESPWLVKAMANAEPVGEFQVDSDYSFSYEKFGDKNVLLAGDAASFIDPVFSSGVYLALESGLLAAKSISSQLKRNSDSESVYKNYTHEIKSQVSFMRRLIDAYYDNRSYEVFMTPKPPFGLERSVNSILAGCLKPPLSVRWRFKLFQLVCRIHKRRPIVPRLNW